MSQSLALLASDFASLSKEAGRRHGDVRDAADKAGQLLKTGKEQALEELRADPPPTQHPFYQPIFLASTTRNAKVIALAVSALQRLIAAGAVPKTLVKQILDTLDAVIAQGVEIQLKVLQTLVSLLTTTTQVATEGGAKRTDRLVQGEELGQALELSHRLSTSKIPVVASTASATLRQLFMFVFERVADEDALVAASAAPEHDASLPAATFDVDVPPIEEDRAATIGARRFSIKPRLIEGDTPATPDPGAAALEEEEGADEQHPQASGEKRARSIRLRPAARDAYLLLEDLCLLVSGSVEGGPDGEPSFLRWGSLSRTFGLELVESIVSGFGGVVRTHPELLLVLRAHLCPLLIRFLSSPPHSTLSSSTSFAFSFPLTLRLTRVVFLLLKHFSDLLTLESEVFLTMFVRVIGPGDKGEGEGGHPAGPTGGQNSPLWMRVLALEIFRGLCGDFTLMMRFYARYDAVSKDGTNSPSAKGGSTVFSDLMTAFNRLATEKPTALGVGAAVTYGSSLGPTFASGAAPHGSGAASASSTALGTVTGSHLVDSAMEMGLGLAQVAGSVVGSAAGAVAGAAAAAGSSGAAGPSLNSQSASMKLQCIDQLDKAEPPPIPDNYIFLLALQCLSALADGFASYTLAAYAQITSQQGGAPADKAPRPLDWAALEAADPNSVELANLKIVQAMAETSWPALLASLSFFIATALSDDLFADVVASLQNFTSVLGVLNLDTPREAFLTSLCKFAMPASVVSHFASQEHHGLGAHASKPTSAAAAATAVLSAGAEQLALLTGTGSASALPIGLSSRNLACLRALMAVAHYLAGSLGYSWFSVFETLQNADFVLRTTAAARGAKKRLAGGAGGAAASTAPGTPGKAGGAGAAGTGANGAVSTAGGAGDAKPIPVLPTEADEQAIQHDIAKLFEVSSTLDDAAFRHFLGALCRLSGEMVGVQMNEDGTVVRAGEEGAGGATSEGTTTPLETPDRSRRRSSGMSAVKARAGGLGEKSFGIAKIGAVALLNVQRLIKQPPEVGWDLSTSHLLFVQHQTLAATTIRLQAADVLGQILVVAPKNLEAAGDLDFQKRVQTQVLSALAVQAEPAPRLQTTTDVDIRRLALESLLKILESNGHAFVAGWDRIFHVLRTACPSATYIAPPSPAPPASSRHSLDTISEHENLGPMTPLRSSVGAGGGGYFGANATDGAARSAKTAILVRTSFPSLQLICTDFLDALSDDEIRDCIDTLADFGQQTEDVNVALTAGGLLWSVSDHVQAKRKESDDDVGAHPEIWMFLLQNLLNLARDSRQEVRDAAITNVFRSLSMYGASLSKETWEACCWEIVFPLVDDISTTIRQHDQRSVDDDDEMNEETVPQINGPPIRLLDKQWDDSKTLALSSLGDVFFDYLPQIVKTERYEDTWLALVGHLKRSFMEDRPIPATAAVQALEKILTVSLDMAEASRISSSWEVAWSAWAEIGHAIESNSAATPAPDKLYTQVNLEAFVRAVLPIYTPPYLAFDLARVQRLLAILKAVLTYRRSPDYRPDIDGLMPLQAAVLEVVAVIKLDDVPGAAAAVLADLAEYLTLAFVAPFEATPDSSLPGRRAPQVVTYIALTKEVMPHVQWLYRKYRADTSVYDEGAVQKMLEAYALPMKLKHACPAPAKFGSAEPLWKTATINFLKAVRDVVANVKVLESELAETTRVAVWEAVVNGFSDALLADNSSSSRANDVYLEENFDLALLVSLERDILPHIGTPVVPDRLLRRLSKTLQIASRLYRLDYPYPSTSTSLSPSESTPAPTPPEPRFDLDFDRQVRGEVRGTTVEVVETPRERFAYWCFDLLFLLCEATEEGEDDPARRRLAALALPALLNRCAAIIKTYDADAPLRGKMPFPRIRQEELLYVLHRLTSLRLPPNTLWASLQPSPSAAVSSPPPIDPTAPGSLAALVRTALLRSPLAHLYELHPLLTDLVALARAAPSVAAPYVPQRYLSASSSSAEGEEGEKWEGLPAGFEVGRVGRRRAQGGEGGGAGDGEMQDVVQLAVRALKMVGGEIGAGEGLV
ncbi:hypothetical protein JCM10207_007749 [Rhodosporidiobolus poonsookiae]